MDYKKEKELTFFSLIFIITLDISLLCQTITCLIFYLLLTPITITSIFFLIYYIRYEKSKKIKKLENVLYVDKKTGLPNKNSLLNDINKTIKNNKEYCLLVFSAKNSENKANEFLVNYIKNKFSDKEIRAVVEENIFALMTSYRFKTDIMNVIKELELELKSFDSKQKLY